MFKIQNVILKEVDSNLDVKFKLRALKLDFSLVFMQKPRQQLFGSCLLYNMADLIILLSAEVIK
jgi:hypothetical protein